MHVFTTTTGQVIGRFASYDVGVAYCRAHDIINYCVNYADQAGD